MTLIQDMSACCSSWIKVWNQLKSRSVEQTVCRQNALIAYLYPFLLPGNDKCYPADRLSISRVTAGIQNVKQISKHMWTGRLQIMNIINMRKLTLSLSQPFLSSCTHINMGQIWVKSSKAQYSMITVNLWLFVTTVKLTPKKSLNPLKESLGSLIVSACLKGKY